MPHIKIIINEIIYRTSFIVSIPENYIKKSYLTIQDHLALYKEYDLTKEKLNKLQAQKYNVDFLIAENNSIYFKNFFSPPF